MRSLKRLNQPLLLLLAVLILTLGCEDSGVNAPSDAQIIMNADPATVTIDDVDGDTHGTSDIMAQLFDASGFALSGVSVTFSASDGTLASKPAEDEPAIPVETDANGIARDVLTLLVDDDPTVEVGARSGTLSGSVEVIKVVGSQNSLPTAVITDTPADEQQKYYDVDFSGRDSFDPDGGIITCYQWTILADWSDDDLPVSKTEKVWQGLGKVRVSETFFKAPQSVGVTLRVSDDPDAASWCAECVEAAVSCGAAATEFSPNFDDISYDIVCDLSDPIADAGGDQTGVVGQEITLYGGASNDPDPDVTIDIWRWSCGNVTDPQDTEDAYCTYGAADTYTATLTVTNSCGRTAEDEIQVTINPAP